MANKLQVGGSAYISDTLTVINGITGNLNGTATKANSIATETASTDAYRPIFFGYQGNNEKLVYNDNLQYNPNKGIFKIGAGTLTATQYSGNASTATTASTCSGNAATATKLQTPRTIGGQSFDGSGNVGGNIISTGNIIPSVTNTSDLGSNTLSYRNVYTTGVGAPSSTALSFGAANGTHLIIDTSGNVGIGTTSPTSKLHVAGNGYFTSNISSAANIIAGDCIKGETVKISSGCTLEYDSTQKCVKFVFN